MEQTISYVITTHNRKDELADAIESIRQQEHEPMEIVVVIDNSSDGTKELFEAGGRFDETGIKSRYLNEWIGTPRARNIGASMTTGDILVFLDDDAIIDSPKAAARIAERFQTDDQLGILALCIENYYTGEIDRAEFPHREREPRRDESFETTYFIGAGHAVRTDALASSGGYPSDFMFYRFEEVDLSFRVLDQGYRIRYEPSVVVRHKQSPKGRSPDNTIIRYELENRIRTSIRNLPWRHVLVSTVVWICYTVYRSGFDPRPVISAIGSLVCSFRTLHAQRSRVDDETVRLLARRSGRLYY